MYFLANHEAVICNLLEILLYHQSACEELGDYALDLADYGYTKIVGLLA